MPQHSETRILPYAPEQIFALVADVERYPEFLPWCVACRITSRPSPNELTADLAVGFKTRRGIWMAPREVRGVEADVLPVPSQVVNEG